MKNITPEHIVELGAAWAGSSVNCKPYSVEPIVIMKDDFAHAVATGVFYDAKGQLVVYSTSLVEGGVTSVSLGSNRLPKDAHDTACIQQDKSGRLHVLGGAHCNFPLYYRSSSPLSPLEFTVCSGELPDEMKDASYPSLLKLKHDESLWLMYRLGKPHRSQWRVLKWNNKDSRWSDTPRTLLSGMFSGGWGAGPYVNQPILFSDGRVGLSFCWRSQAVEGGKRNPLNIGIDYVECHKAFSEIRTGNGIELSFPVFASNSERIVPVPWGADLSNQNGACLLTDETPAFVANFRNFGEKRQLWFFWKRSDNSWGSRRVTSFEYDEVMTGKGTLPSLVSRAVVVPVSGERVVILYRDNASQGRLLAKPLSGPDYRTDKHPIVCLIPGGLDQYEPTVERLESSSTGKLVVYIQPVEQDLGGDNKLVLKTSTATLQVWNLEAFFC